jgi:serine/threonine protein kinase/WD40 repeat protein
MPNLSCCPDAQSLQRLMLGQISGPEGDSLEQHVSECRRCADTLQVLKAEDTLVEAMRAQKAAAEKAENDTVEELIKRLRQQPPASVTAGGADSLPATGAPTGDGTEPLCDFLAPAQDATEIGRLGGYRILKVLGAGGMGVVFHAEDLQLKRSVALKTMKPSAHTNAAARQRFLREARAAAAIEHDHIVTIHQVGEDRGVPFLAMQLLQGETLEQRLQRDGKLRSDEALRIGREIAAGLAAAHERGLIHRDIKPANIFLVSGGVVSGEWSDQHSSLITDHSPKVKILDFGLARSAADDAQLTKSGTILGTPSYMAPEQARGEKVDPLCDLFSLGCVLYRMTTGELPFKGATTMNILTALALDNPKPPPEINPDVPRSLSDFIMQLLAKNPAERPSSARAVVRALEGMERAAVTAKRDAETRGLPDTVRSHTEARGQGDAGPMVVAGSPPRRVAASPRRRLVMAIAAVLLVALGPLAYLFGPTVVRIVTNKGELVIENENGDVAVTVKQGGIVLHDRVRDRKFELAAGDGEIEVFEAASGLHLFTKKFTLTRNGKVTVNVRLEVAKAPAAPPVGEVRRFEGHRDNINGIAFSPDGLRMLTTSGRREENGQLVPGDDYTLRLWDLKTGKELRRFEGHTYWVTGVAFSHDGKRAATASWDKTVRLWDLETGKQLHVFQGHTDGVGSVKFSPDDRRIVTGSLDRTARLWNVATGKEVQRFVGHVDVLASVEFSPDGRQVLTSAAGDLQDGKWLPGTDYTLRLWDVATGKELSRIEGHAGWIWSAGFAGRGDRVFSSSLDRTVRFWDAHTGKELKKLTHPDWVISAAVSADGRRVFTSCKDQTLRLWDVDSGQVLVQFRVDGWEPTCVDITPDGRWALSGGRKGVARLWRLP